MSIERLGRHAGILLVATLAAGCSDSPSAPSAAPADVSLRERAPSGIPAGGVLKLVSGEDGRPVSGARVRIHSQVLTTDASGEAEILESIPEGASIDVQADGFLERRTRVRNGSTTLELWPTTSPTGLDEAYTRTLVYTSALLDSSGELEPLGRLSLESPRVAIVVSDPIRRDALAMERVTESAKAITLALGGAIVYAVSDDPGAVQVTLDVDPTNEQIVEDDLRAFARCRREKLVIQGCEIVFRSVEVVRSATTLHELGHTFGLNHSPDRREIMGQRRLRSPDRFSAREELAMHLMLKRLPGNLFPDDDRQSPAAQRASASSRVVVCRHPR